MTEEEFKNLYIGVMPEDFKEYLEFHGSTFDEFFESMNMIALHAFVHDKEWRVDLLTLANNVDKMKAAKEEAARPKIMDVNGRPLPKSSKLK